MQTIDQQIDQYYQRSQKGFYQLSSYIMIDGVVWSRDSLDPAIPLVSPKNP